MVAFRDNSNLLNFMIAKLLGGVGDNLRHERPTDSRAHYGSSGRSLEVSRSLKTPCGNFDARRECAKVGFAPNLGHDRPAWQITVLPYFTLRVVELKEAASLGIPTWLVAETCPVTLGWRWIGGDEGCGGQVSSHLRYLYCGSAQIWTLLND